MFFISIGMLLDLKALAGNPGGILIMVLVIVMIKVAMVTVIGIERNGEVHRMPSASLRLKADDVLLFIGRREDMDCATEYLDSSPDKPVQCPIRREEL